MKLTMSPIAVLLVEDKYLIAEAISRLLDDYQELKVVAIATNYDEALFQLSQQPIDILLLDLQIPLKNLGKIKMAGFEVLEAVKSHFSSVKTIILSNYGDYEFIKRTASMGAKGYLLKNTHSLELYEAILAVYKGGSYFQNEVTKQLQTKKSTDDDSEPTVAYAKLTKREKEVVKLLAHGFTSNDISKALGINSSTINEYRNNIMDKLRAKNAAEMIRIIYENDLLES